ncbi:hypothetical protein SAMN05216282_10583 [Cryobacterium psychrotolerans]|uniref:Exodeoxyribonuclease X-like C-terminal domain-containing protein n=1 Tax=Cryobacterium psychrotolerans TaxID=386301 RepID=A0A1G9B793_9MICO|nr:hypothetical protein [Cryobacterium psychrotolerans]TFD84655.1 hypothetical protein E3T56_09350 [Cryobacterium psychrotolerans]SDK35416.1 hypothetical protein SAMN05216282_10583 [Cryobacterium psychrotolerans]
MSEIVRVEDPPMIRFGKHSGKSAAEVMATDPAYVQWALAQPWFQEKNPTLVQFFVNGSVAGLGNATAEPAETPEHNALQAKFTQDAYCLAAVAMFSAGRKLRTASEVQSEAESLVGAALAGHVTSSHPSIEQRSFEVNAWDVQFSYYGASSEMDPPSEPSCSCVPIPLPDVPDELPPHGVEVINRDDTDALAALKEFRRLHHARKQKVEDRAAIAEVNRNRNLPGYRPFQGRLPERAIPAHRALSLFESYTSKTKHESTCPRSTSGYFSKWGLLNADVVEGATARIGLELKPTMGDDFPAVLRQVLGYMKRATQQRAHFDAVAVVVGEFMSMTVSWPVVKKQFWESGVLLVQEAELDALVEQYAHDWGIDLSVPEADFTVSFTDQL